VTAFLMFDLTSGAFTSIVAALGIIARSGDLVGGAMKGIAEVSTVTGLAGGRYISRKLSLGTGPSRVLSYVAGVVLRIIVMSVWNLIVLPRYNGIPFNVVVSMLPLLALFNGIQGALTVVLGTLLHEAYLRRVPR